MKFTFTYFTIFIITVFQFLNAQNILVSSFKKLDNSLTARIDAPKKDKNGDVCAIIKIVTTETGFTFEGDGAGIFATEYNAAEYWIWVGYGAKRLTIKHPKLGVLRDYQYPIPIEKATDYEMVLHFEKKLSEIIDTAESKWLIINAEPPNASVYINNILMGQGSVSKKTKPGIYEYRVEAPYYHSFDSVVLIKNQNISVNVNLRPAFGFLQINSLPEDSADITLDGKHLPNVTPFKTDTLASGEHMLSISKNLYLPITQKAIVKDNQTSTITLKMPQNYADIEISTLDSVSIWINNQFMAEKYWKGRLKLDNYLIEARNPFYKTEKKQIEINTVEPQQIELIPTYKTGNIAIKTNTDNVNIKINGVEYGKTPKTIENLKIGEYTVLLYKEGFAPLTAIYSVMEDKTTSSTENLIPGKTITINTNPSEADLWIDNIYIGKTPQTKFLVYSEYKIVVSNKFWRNEKKYNIEANGLTTIEVPLLETSIISYKKYKEKGLEWNIIKTSYALNNNFDYQFTELQPEINYQISSRFNYYIFMFEMGYSVIKYNNSSLTNEISSILHKGFISDLCIMPLPYMGDFSYRIKPYIGGGFYAGGLEALDADGNRVSYINTYTPYWKAGLYCLPFKKIIFLDCEYKKTISNSNVKRFSRFLISFGLNINF